jgi:hypothetical protein
VFGFDMSWLYSLCLAAHVIGWVLVTDGATTKLALLLKSKADPAYLPPYLAIANAITRLILPGLVLLTLAGIGLLLLGHALTVLIVVKLAMVVLIFVLGPLIDNVVEPRFRELAPVPGSQIRQLSFAFSDAIHCWKRQRPGFSTSSSLCGCWDDLRNCGPCEVRHPISWLLLARAMKQACKGGDGS